MTKYIYEHNTEKAIVWICQDCNTQNTILNKEHNKELICTGCGEEFLLKLDQIDE